MQDWGGCSEGQEKCEVLNFVSIDCVYSFIIASFFFRFKGGTQIMFLHVCILVRDCWR